MRPTTLPTRLITGLAIVMTAAGCAATGTSPAPAATPGPSVVEAPAPTTRPEPIEESRDAWLVVGRPGEAGLRVIRASSGEQDYVLPVGIPDPTWRTIRTVTPGDPTSRIEDIVVQPGMDAWRELTLDGAWRLPTVGLDPLPGGISADGSTMVLVPDGKAADDPAVAVSRFAIVDGALTRTPRIVEFPGVFDFDALSPDGTILYVAEHVPDPVEGRYQVRAVDTATGVMRDTVIVDKRNIDETMAGWPVDQALRPDGVVLTLYRGVEHPFIHALQSREAWAVCLDLPARGMDDESATADWGVVSTNDGDIAVNATLGIAAAVTTDLTIRRTVDFEPAAASGFRLAKFGHGEAGSVGRRVIADPAGSAVFAAGAGGIVRLAPTDLAVTGRFLDGNAIDALALTPDGRTLYALLRADGRIAALDALTGEVVGWSAGEGYDRLVGIQP